MDPAFLHSAVTMVEQVSIEWVKVWLRGRDETNLLVIGNPKTRILGFADKNSCNAVLFNLSQLRNNVDIMKLYDKTKKLQAENPPPKMIHRWLNVISSN